MSNTRKPIVAGRFYPADATSLGMEVKEFLAQSEAAKSQCTEQFPLGIMVPHASYLLAGPLIGKTLGQVTIPETVIILAPNHTGRGADLAVWPDGSWITPLDETKVDDVVAEALVAHSTAGYVSNSEAHLMEHSIEVIVPFLQALNQYIRIVPVVVSALPAPRLDRAAEELASLVKTFAAQGEKISIIATSDLSQHSSQEETAKAGKMLLEHIQSLDPEGLLKVTQEKNINMCGVSSVYIMLQAVKHLGAKQCCLAGVTDSSMAGETFGAAKDSVIGYAGAIFTA